VGRIKDFAIQRPFLFVVLLILSALLVEALAGFLAVVLFGVEQTGPLFAPLVLLVTTFYFGSILWAFQWLKAAGVGSLGSWKGWAAALILLAYYLFALLYAFFGEFSFTVPAEALGGLKIATLFLNVVFEEILFRGLILYALVSVWGATRKGVLKAVIVTALLFGLIHGLNALTGDTSEVPGQIAIALFESLWWSAIVLCWGSVWPVALIHGVTNWVLQTKALSVAGYHGTAGAYALAVLLGLPLAALGLWWVSRNWQGLTNKNYG
jgi:membrane protease YdiL (CAAX protease family)